MTIYKQALQRIATNKIKLLALLLMPLLFIVVFAAQESRMLTVGIVDHDRSAASGRLISELKGIEQVKVVLLKEKSVLDKMISYQVQYTIMIDQGLEERLMDRQSPAVKEFVLQEQPSLSIVRSKIDQIMKEMKQLASEVDYNRDKFDLVVKSGAQVQQDGSHPKAINERLAMGLLVQFMLYMSVVTAGLVLEDKSSGVFHRVFFAPVTLGRYMLENMLAFFTIGALQVTIIMGLMKIMFGMEIRVPMYVLFLLFSLVCISLGMWLVSMFKKPIGAYITIVLVTTPLVMLGGSYWTQDFLPEKLQAIARFVPTTWVMNGVDQLLTDGKALTDLTSELVVLLLFAGVFLAAGLMKRVDVYKDRAL